VPARTASWQSPAAMRHMPRIRHVPESFGFCRTTCNTIQQGFQKGFNRVLAIQKGVNGVLGIQQGFQRGFKRGFNGSSALTSAKSAAAATGLRILWNAVPRSANSSTSGSSCIALEKSAMASSCHTPPHHTAQRLRASDATLPRGLRVVRRSTPPHTHRDSGLVARHCAVDRGWCVVAPHHHSQRLRASGATLPCGVRVVRRSTPPHSTETQG
jgi:hypothetical protein